MDNDKRCSRCGTMNEPEYVYCKNCGNLLGNSETQPQNIHYTPINYNTTYPYAANDYSEIEPEINGVDTKKLQAYVGVKNRDKIMARFIIAHKTGKKVPGFNWVVFITGALLAFPFVSSWFFYRKMFKVGAILCAMSIALTIVVTAVNFPANSENLRKEYSKIKDYSVEQIIEEETQSLASTTSANTVDAVVKLGITIFLAINAWQIYYKQSTARIKKLELSNFQNNNQFYQLAGLPSTAAAILIPLGVRFLEIFISLAPAVSLIASGADIEKVLLMIFL